MKRVVVITGSSAGIGKETARYFAEMGWQVVATMRNPDNELELGSVKNIELRRMDITSNSDIQEVLEGTISKYGKIDTIVNNAGIGVYGAFEAASDEQIFKQYETNVFGTMKVIKTIIPHFRANRGGLILNVTSAAGKIALPYQSLYDSSKFAMEGFSESLQYELAPLGIRVKLVLPGNIKTNFFNSYDTTNVDSLLVYQDQQQKVIDNYLDLNNKGIKPVKVAKVIFQAATDKSKKFRYLAGPDAGLYVRVRKFLPDGLFFTIVKNKML